MESMYRSDEHRLVEVAAKFLPRDASAERGYEIAFVCLSVCLSVCNVQVPCSNTLEFFEKNFTAE